MQIDANGISIAYELAGPENAPVVMFSHSLATNYTMWSPQIDALQAHYRVLRYDTRGHGQSSAPAGAYDLTTLAADAVGLIDALDIARVNWVGLSMGGMIGQVMGLDHGDRIGAMVLCDTASAVPAAAAATWGERIANAHANGMEPLVEPTIERWFTPPYIEAAPAVVNPVRTMIRTTPVDGYVGCCEAIRTLNLTARLSAIDRPTLVMVGEEDVGTPVAVSEAIVAEIDGAELVVLPSASHLSNLEQADRFNGALLAFLDKHAA
jgi:3-oxoadipate enol-lactonase